MRKTIILVLGLSAFIPAQAQIFTSEGITGAGIGALAGGLIGHGSGGHGWEGAAIGAGAGFLFGSLAHHSRARERYYYSPYYSYQGPAGYYYTSSYVPTAPQTAAVTETAQAAPQPPAPAPAPAPAPPVSNMAGANSLFGR